MNTLLIGGTHNVGKSETIYNIAKKLLTKNFKEVAGNIPTKFDDFYVVLERSDENGKTTTIILNSATDTPNIIKRFKQFFDENGTYHILISSIRDDGFYPRKEFFNIMVINPNDKNLIEIPLAKITRRGKNFGVALNWYSQKIEKLIIHTLSNSPFNI